jgi:uncharacterized SAM-binding protein YcdF (DUF218 family)
MDKQYDAIIVLGGGRNNSGDLTPLSTQRLDKGGELFKQGVSPKVFALGGYKSTYSPQAITFDRTGATLRSEYLQTLGVPIDSVVLVENGKDTIGEAFASREIARELNAKSLLVVTSDKHMERSLFIFRRIFGQDFQIDGSGVPCGDLLNSDEEKEYLGVVERFFSGLPENIPNPDPESWYQDHADLYQQYKEIHDRFHPTGKESQAYSGVRKEL